MSGTGSRQQPGIEVKGCPTTVPEIVLLGPLDAPPDTYRVSMTPLPLPASTVAPHTNKEPPYWSLNTTFCAESTTAPLSTPMYALDWLKVMFPAVPESEYQPDDARCLLGHLVLRVDVLP